MQWSKKSNICLQNLVEGKCKKQNVEKYKYLYTFTIY